MTIKTEEVRIFPSPLQFRLVEKLAVSKYQISQDEALFCDFTCNMQILIFCKGSNWCDESFTMPIFENQDYNCCSIVIIVLQLNVA